MNILWLTVLLHTVFAQTQSSFGRSYLKDTKLCQPWTCINNKLGLPDFLPPKDQYAAAIRLLMPLGPWQDVVEDVLNVCYGDRPRMYTNTCPGQALLHCTVDNLIQHCPDESWRKDDACAPVSSLAGLMYMFQQSRYENLEKNLPTDKRPSWFLKNYFSSKCCNLPNLFNSTLLNECGFKSMILYHSHEPRNGYTTPHNLDHNPKVTTTTPRSDGDKVKLVDINTITNKDTWNAEATPNNDLDPLGCCDLSGFIEPSWREECDFHLTWNKETRLTIQTPPESVTVPSTTTAKPDQMKDVKVVPESCEKETCVFRKLNIITDSGSVDIDAFSKLLDNMTSAHKSWTKAKARVVTKCLSKPITDYVEDCEINKVLACTFDVLSENCPHSTKHDICKHSSSLRNDTMCQISSSKFRPKHRRQYCGLPSLVKPDVLAECGINSISRMEYVPDPVTSRPKTHWWIKARHSCKSMTDSTKCLLKKMGVLNKYGFLDYFKMKDSIRKFTSVETSWENLTVAYLTFFTATPMYENQCNTPKKFLNVIDAMLMTCPMSKRKHTLQCNRTLSDMLNTPFVRSPLKDFYRKMDEQRHFDHVYNPNAYHPSKPVTQKPKVSQPVVRKNTLFDFGLINLKDAPPVQLIDLKPTTRPLVLLPVYLRMNGQGVGTISVRPISGGILRK